MAQPNAHDALLAQSRDLFRDRICEALGGMLSAADATFTELADKTKDDEQKCYLEARDLAAANSEVIASQFQHRFTTEFQKVANKAKKIAPSLSDFSLDDLALVAEDDLEETLKFNALAAKVRRHCEQELGALDQRARVLFNDAALESEDNPFGPQVILDAYKHALKQLECPADRKLAFLELFEAQMLDPIGEAYDGVNELLVDNNVLPKIRYTVTRSKSSGAAKAKDGGAEKEKEGAKEEAKAPEAEAPVSPQDMFAQLAKALGGGAAAPVAPGMGVGGIPVVEGAQLMSSLSQLQVGNLAALGEAAAELGPILAEAGNLKNVLHQLKSTSVGNSMGQVDAMTLDIVAMLFDQLFDDDKIPIALKGLIGRLQLPMLKVAIADKELFSSKTHPARQLLDVLGQIGMRLPPEFDSESPLFPRLEKFIQELVDGFQEKMEIFDQVRAQLEAIIAEEDKRVAEQMKATEAQLQQQEKLAVASAAAQDEIRTRVMVFPKTPRPVVDFLCKQWIKYLVISHAREGKESRAFIEGSETIDQLVWSVAPKPTMEERRKLAGTIPPLLKRLKAGVTAAGIEEPAAQGFFTEMMKLHTEVMRAPIPAAAPTPPPAPAAAKKPVYEVTDAMGRPLNLPPKPGTETATKRPATETATKKPLPPPDDILDFTAPVEVNNPFGEGKVAVSADDLDFTAAEAAAAATTSAPAAAGAPTLAPTAAAPAGAKPGGKPAKPRDTIRLPSAMVVGAWIDVLDQDGETHRIGKLHYVSPMKSHFLFVDRKGAKVYECSRSMLARRLKLGEIQLLEGEPDASLFDRIMTGIFGKLKTPVPA